MGGGNGWLIDVVNVYEQNCIMEYALSNELNGYHWTDGKEM